MDTVIVIDAVSLVLAGIGTGLVGAVFGGLLILATFKRGPQGKQGYPGPIGATGMKGEPGRDAVINIEEFKLGKFWVWRDKRSPKIRWGQM